MRKKTSKLIISMTLIFMIVLSSVNIGQAKDITSAAKELMGVPYLWGGTTTNGFDCSGFSQYAFRQIGIELPRTSVDQYNTGKKVSRDQLQIGDLVFFETYRPGPSHLGIYVGNDQFIHASSTKGVTISSLNNVYWKPRYIGARRVIEEKQEKLKGIEDVKQDLVFSDVDKNFWAYNEILALNKQGLISGYADQTFKPNQALTRAEAVAVLAKATGLDKPISNVKIADVSIDSWMYAPAAALVEKEIISLDDSGNLNPNSELTRADMATLLNNAFNIEGSSQAVSFDDVLKTSEAYPAIAALSSTGILTGKDDNQFKPKENVTRAQFTVALYRVLKVK